MDKKLTFHFTPERDGARNSLLQALSEYISLGVPVLLLSANRTSFEECLAPGTLGFNLPSERISPNTNLLARVEAFMRSSKEAEKVVLIEGGPFLSEAQVDQLQRAAKTLRIPVKCFGGHRAPVSSMETV